MCLLCFVEFVRVCHESVGVTFQSHVFVSFFFPCSTSSCYISQLQPMKPDLAVTLVSSILGQDRIAHLCLSAGGSSLT